MISKIINKISRYYNLLINSDTLEIRLEKSKLLDVIDKVLKKDGEISSSWIKFLKMVRQDARRWPLTAFLNWRTIQLTMFYRNIPFFCFTQIEQDKLLKCALIEDRFGVPPASKFNSNTSDNLLHHAYSLLQIKDTLKINNLKNVVEFGAGYGSMARLILKINNNIKYKISDLEVFECLQKIFLKQTLGSIDNISWDRDLVDIKADLFISTWALSEVPLILRDRIFKEVKADFWLIAFQSNFDGIDNIAYFRSIADDYADRYDFHIYEIRHIPNNYYMIGKIRDYSSN